MVTIPSLSSNKAYAEACRQFDAMKVRQDEGRHRCDALAAKFNKAHGVARADLDGAAQALIADVTGNAAGQVESVDSELRQARADQLVIDHAVEMAKQARGGAHTEASRAICKKLVPEHEKLAWANIRAVFNAYAAHIALLAFYSALDHSGASWSGNIVPVPFRRLGRNVEINAPIGAWIRELIEAGHDPKKIERAAPEVVRGDVRKIVNDLKTMKVI